MDFYLVAVTSSFLSIILLFTGLSSLKKAKRKQVNSRLEKYTKKSRDHSPAEEISTKQDDEPVLRKIFKTCGGLLAPRGWIKQAELELAQADIPLRPEEYVGLQMLMVITLALFLFYTSSNVMLTGAGAIIAAIIPPTMVKRAKRKRINQFNNQLSEGLTVMANSLRAGFSFMQAVDTLSKEMPPPLSTEFARLLKEMNLGTTTESALDNLMRRVDSKDLDLVVTSVKIQRQVGGNLAEIIDNIAKTIQQRIKLQGNLKTLTAQGRISGLIIGLLPIFIILFVSLLNPSYLTTLVTNPAGLFMLAYALVSEIIGFLIIKKIVTIDF